MPILHSSGVMTPGQFGPDQPRGGAGEHRLHAHHVVDRNALGDAHDQLDAGIGRFEDRVGGERRRHVDHAGRGAGLAHRVVHGIEHRQAQVLLAAAPGRHAADQLGAVGERLLGMEGALLAGEALADDPGVLVDQNAHACNLSCAQRDDLARRIRQILGRGDGEPALGEHRRAPARRWCPRGAPPPAPSRRRSSRR